MIREYPHSQDHSKLKVQNVVGCARPRKTARSQTDIAATRRGCVHLPGSRLQSAVLKSRGFVTDQKTRSLNRVKVWMSPYMLCN